MGGRWVVRVLCSVSLGFLWVPWGLAQDAPDRSATTGPVEVGAVLVTPRRIPGLSVNASEFPGHATVITKEDIRASSATSIPELLSQYEGMTVLDSRGFGLGADSTVNLRGVVNSSRTNALVLVNGVRQNRLTGDEVHWQSLPVEDIERIEIIRGGGSLIYGEGALAGVISITTKQGAEQPLKIEQGLELGSFGHERYFTSLRGRSGPVSYGASYQRRDATGYRESTGSRTTTVTNHLGIDVRPDLRLEANVRHSEDTSYFAGGLTPEQSQARRVQTGSLPGFFEDAITEVALDTVWSGPQGLSLVANAFWRLWESDSVTTSRFATINPAQGLSLRGGHEAGGESLRHTLVGGIDLLDEKASTATRTSTYSESNKASYGLFLEETLRLMDRASLTAGVRFDKSRFEEDITFPAFIGTLRFEGWSPKMGLSVDVLEPLTVYASFARPFKAPSVDDFSVAIPGTGFVGNIDLEPQQGSEFEVGFRFDQPKVGQLETAVFFNRIDDEILFNDLPGSDTNQNFDTRRFGLELLVRPRLPDPRLRSTLTYTFMDAEFRTGAFNGNTLPAVPDHRLTANLTAELIPNLFGSLDWLLVQDLFRINDFNNTLPADNYGVLNLGLRWEHENTSVYFTIENVTNEEYTSFQSSNGVTVSTGENPSPPITFRGGVKVRF